MKFRQTTPKRILQYEAEANGHGAMMDWKQAATDIGALRVVDLISRRIVACSPTTPIRDAARVMTENRVGSILILDDAGLAAGIVTDTDLRRALALDFHGSVGEIMSHPVIALPADALAFEAIYEMLRNNINHIVVIDGEHPRGVISSRDVLAAHSDSPMFLAREIDRAKTFAQCAAVYSRAEAMVSALVSRGVGAYNLGRITAEMNDRLVRRIITLVEAEFHDRRLGPPPARYCWLGLGSEGRREQTLKTDQDNALVYEDQPDFSAQNALDYFRLFASRVVEELVSCGFPPCNGGIMASNPKWCQPLSVWKNYFSLWVRETDPANLLHATIFFDFRAISGDTSLADDLRAHLSHEIARQKAFVGVLAKVALNHRPPLGLLRNILVERNGDHKGAVDLKRRGLLPLIEAVRVYAMEHGVISTNTCERIWDLASKGVFSHDEAVEIAAAYEFIMLLRIRHQIEQIEGGESPDNYVVPENLTRAERGLLKEYFAAIANLQSYMESHYLTWLMA